MPPTYSKRGHRAPPFHADPFCRLVSDPVFRPHAVESDHDDDDDDPKLDELLSLDDLPESSHRLLLLFSRCFDRLRRFRSFSFLSLYLSLSAYGAPTSQFQIVRQTPLPRGVEALRHPSLAIPSRQIS